MGLRLNGLWVEAACAASVGQPMTNSALLNQALDRLIASPCGAANKPRLVLCQAAQLSCRVKAGRRAHERKDAVLNVVITLQCVFVGPGRKG